jgi:hypothetical protein
VILTPLIDSLESFFDRDDPDTRQAKMRRSVSRDNRAAIRANLFAGNNAPQPDRLRPRLDEVVER